MEMIWFFFSYSTSILTASLGLTKLLLVGPCPILSEKGLLNGLLTWRFFFCFLGVLSSMLTKAFFIVFAIGGVQAPGSTIPGSNSEVIRPLIGLALLIIPSLTLSTISILGSTGFKCWKIIFEYPGLWLLSVATYYTVGPKNVQFCSLERNLQRKKLGFSKKLSVINMIMTNFMFLVTFWFIVFYDIAETGFKDGFFSTLGHFFIWGFYTAPFLIFAFIFNLIFMVLDLDCCCNRSQSCCPKLCCGPQCFGLRREYIDTNNGIEIWKCDDEELYHG